MILKKRFSTSACLILWNFSEQTWLKLVATFLSNIFHKNDFLLKKNTFFNKDIFSYFPLKVELILFQVAWNFAMMGRDMDS